MDPVVTSDEHVSETKAAMVSLIKAIDEDLSIHDYLSARTVIVDDQIMHSAYFRM